MKLLTSIRSSIIWVTLSFLALCLLIVLDITLNTTERFPGCVVSKYFNASRTYVGTSGNMSVAPEEFILAVKVSNGQVITVMTAPEVFYEKGVGDTVSCIAIRGYFTSMVYGYSTL